MGWQIMRDGDCIHIFSIINKQTCDLCNQPTHEINWQKQNKLKEQWHQDNPDAQYEGWMSI
jgi:hypothetical protein